MSDNRQEGTQGLELCGSLDSPEYDYVCKCKRNCGTLFTSVNEGNYGDVVSVMGGLLCYLDWV